MVTFELMVEESSMRSDVSVIFCVYWNLKVVASNASSINGFASEDKQEKSQIFFFLVHHICFKQKMEHRLEVGLHTAKIWIRSESSYFK